MYQENGKRRLKNSIWTIISMSLHNKIHMYTWMIQNKCREQWTDKHVCWHANWQITKEMNWWIIKNIFTAIFNTILGAFPWKYFIAILTLWHGGMLISDWLLTISTVPVHSPTFAVNINEYINVLRLYCSYLTYMFFLFTSFT